MIFIDAIGLTTLVIGLVVVLAKTAGPLADHEKPEDRLVWWEYDNDVTMG